MPYIHILTTAALTPEKKTELKRCALNAADLLGKPRKHMMVLVQDAQALTKGDGEDRCAFCDVRVMGSPEPDACARFAAALSADIARVADTAPGCVYLSLSALTQCYTDGCLPPGH